MLCLTFFVYSVVKVDGSVISMQGRDDRETSVRDLECPVCYQLDALLVLVPCGHMLCGHCWHGCRDRCPLCRAESRGLEIRWP
jgi:hypothetical protein